MRGELVPTPEHRTALALLLHAWDAGPGSRDVSVEDIWKCVRDQVLEAVLDQIDEERNSMAYGACGCAEAVRAMKGDGR